MNNFTIPSYEDYEVSTKAGNRLVKKNFDKWKKDILYGWISENKKNPYPTESQKDQLAEMCKMTKKQIVNWFTNARKVSHPLIPTWRPCQSLFRFNFSSYFQFLWLINLLPSNGIKMDSCKEIVLGLFAKDSADY